MILKLRRLTCVPQNAIWFGLYDNGCDFWIMILDLYKVEFSKFCFRQTGGKCYLLSLFVLCLGDMTVSDMKSLYSQGHQYSVKGWFSNYKWVQNEVNTYWFTSTQNEAVWYQQSELSRILEIQYSAIRSRDMYSHKRRTVQHGTSEKTVLLKIYTTESHSMLSDYRSLVCV